MKRLILPLSLLALFPASSWAFRFSPMVAEMEPKGMKSAQTFVIENNGKERIAVQFEVFKRIVDVTGVETREPTGDLAVFPDQATLEPGAKRSIKVSWVSGPQVPVELPFRLVVTQLPIDFKPGKTDEGKPGTNLNFLLQYVASIYVGPRSAKPKVVVSKVEPLEGSRLRVSLKNDGNAHQLLRGIRLRAGKARTEIPRKSLEALDSENLLPGATRDIVIPAPADIGETPLVEMELPSA